MSLRLESFLVAAGLASSISFTSGCGLAAPGSEATILCGRSASFATWAFARETIATATNLNPERGRLELGYHAGMGDPAETWLVDTAELRGKWAGYPLEVQYLWYEDASGNPVQCPINEDAPAHAPVLVFATK